MKKKMMEIKCNNSTFIVKAIMNPHMFVGFWGYFDTRLYWIDTRNMTSTTKIVGINARTTIRDTNIIEPFKKFIECHQNGEKWE